MRRGRLPIRHDLRRKVLPVQQERFRQDDLLDIIARMPRHDRSLVPVMNDGPRVMEDAPAAAPGSKR